MSECRDAVTNNLLAVAHKFSRPRLAVLRACKTSLRPSNPEKASLLLSECRDSNPESHEPESCMLAVTLHSDDMSGRNFSLDFFQPSFGRMRSLIFCFAKFLDPASPSPCDMLRLSNPYESEIVRFLPTQKIRQKSNFSLCVGKDSNLRSPKARDLQSLVIDRSTTDAIWKHRHSSKKQEFYQYEIGFLYVCPLVLSTHIWRFN